MADDFRQVLPLHGWPDLSEVEKQLDRHERFCASQKRLWEIANTDIAVRLLQQDEAESEKQVRRAFFMATRDRNTLSQCAAVTMDYLRFLVNRWKELKKS